MTRCVRTPGCTGTIGPSGFCDQCGRAHRRAGRSTPGTVAPGVVAGASWTVAGLVSLPVLEFPADRRIREDPAVPEAQRFCERCGGRVGRTGRDGRPDHGYCGRCGTPFAFVPALSEGDLVADQYEVIGYLARGGLGQVYLARDTHLDGNLVALKRLINKTDPHALAVEVSERRYLTTLDHPAIVRIFNFVTAPDRLFGGQTSYLVMEYLNGMSLAELRRAADDPDQPNVTLPLAHLLAYAHEILTALDHLHRRGLLYSDLHPGNVIRTADRIKLIDLGGVRRADDRSSPLVATPRYRVSDQELATHGPTVRSDLYALGVLLADLAGDPGPAEGTDVGVESFQRLVARARHPVWQRRFASATDLSDQIRGVLSELLPTPDQPARSTVFAPTPALLDAGLGGIPPLTYWTAPTTDPSHTHGRPAPATVARGLPVPRPAPGDPAADFLTTVGAVVPESLLDGLALDTPSVEVAFARCRARLAAGNVEHAAEALATAVTLLGADARFDWRVRWHQALVALVRGDVPSATVHFDAVYDDLPGEVAPKLALAYCAEHSGLIVRATRYHAAVWRRDRLTASAAFGLARLRLTAGDRAGAVAVLDDVPLMSRHHDAARIAAVRVLSTRLDGQPPDAAALNEAARRLAALRLDGGSPQGAARDRLTTVVLEAALDRVLVSGPDGLAAGSVFGDPPSEETLRRRLARLFRTLARQQARRRNDHDLLLDRANAVRPLTLLRLRED